MIDAEADETAGWKYKAALAAIRKPAWLAAKFVGAVFYLPYAGIMKLTELYRRHVQGRLYPLARSAARRLRQAATFPAPRISRRPVRLRLTQTAFYTSLRDRTRPARQRLRQTAAYAELRDRTRPARERWRQAAYVTRLRARAGSLRRRVNPLGYYSGLLERTRPARQRLRYTTVVSGLRQRAQAARRLNPAAPLSRLYCRTRAAYVSAAAIVRRLPARSRTWASGQVTRALRNLRQPSFLYALSSEYHWQRNLDKRLFARKPDLIVLLEDNAEGLTGLVSHGARKRRIPYVILPDYIPNPAEPARYYFNNPHHSAATPAGRLIRYLAPQWVLDYDGKELLRLPGSAIVSRWIRGQRCPQPWILNSGYCSAILLESQSSQKHYEDLGFRPEKLKVVGGAIEDQLHAISLEREERRAELMDKYRLDGDKPLIVCGFPPDQYSAATEGFEFNSYDELCRNWFAVLEAVSDRANVLVVRHPRTPEIELRRYAQERVHIASEPLDAILPVSDLYLACISTTIRWALALAIPVINYDTYRYDYGDFSAARGCTEVTGIDAFRKEIETLLEPGEFDRMRSIAEEDAGRWGLMDGKFQDRLRAALIELREPRGRRSKSTHRQGYRLPRMS
ncbi:hypothetical protein [Hoeflea olei]|uniref:hypothetical protein n=1 Tax=Hoeflea olei TaxID=1480615 RepID=UPI001112AB6C|nr:hypothetical protein [Hoeflea olei]